MVRQIHTGFSGPVLRVSLKRAAMISATGSYLYAGPFACPSPITTVSDSSHSRQTMKERSTTPPAQPLPGITHKRFGLIRFRSPLLPESRLFSLPAGTEMFHFPAFPPHCLCVQQRVTAHDDCRVSPFGHPRITAWLTAPRGLSWPPTSFIGSWCQGIHRAPLKTWPQMLASTVQFSNNDQPPTTPTPKHRVHWGRTEGNKLTLVPSDTQQRARPSLSRSCVPRRSSTNKSLKTVPNSQRSTHEQPYESFARSRLCAP